MADNTPTEEPARFKMLTKITLAKFDGDPPKEGEEKEPVEIIEVADEGFPVDIPHKE
jgi:hypothetical protein